MDLLNPAELEVGRPGWPWCLYVVRVIALVFGYFLAGSGWLIFFLFLSVAGHELNHDDAGYLRFVAYAIVPGWLLLRFAGGLFPFGRRFFIRPQHRG